MGVVSVVCGGVVGQHRTLGGGSFKRIFNSRGDANVEGVAASFLLYEMVDRPPLGNIVDENELGRFVEEFGRKKFAVDGPVGFVGKGVDEARSEKGSGGFP